MLTIIRLWKNGGYPANFVGKGLVWRCYLGLGSAILVCLYLLLILLSGNSLIALLPRFLDRAMLEGNPGIFAGLLFGWILPYLLAVSAAFASTDFTRQYDAVCQGLELSPQEFASFPGGVAGLKQKAATTIGSLAETLAKSEKQLGADGPVTRATRTKLYQTFDALKRFGLIPEDMGLGPFFPKARSCL